ncbi:MAG TPA: hypothetical protein ENJ37_00235 [Deltaproteobacteria bacterium]|nr:hypothetical protein [Deltaproteobacteria bacterium]
MKREGGDRGRVVVDLSTLFDGTARLGGLDGYIARVEELVTPGCEAVLTGRAPVWLYLKVAHALHGRVRRLVYDSPVTGEVEIFDHDPF